MTSMTATDDVLANGADGNNAIKRPTATLPQSWLFWAAIGAGLSYMIPVITQNYSDVTTVWKGAGVALLAIWAARNAWNFDGRLIAGVLGFGAMADMVLELNFLVGGTIFAIGHMIAIYFYLRNRRANLTVSQIMLALLLVPLATYTAWAMPHDTANAHQAGLYSLFVTAMAAAAWISRFPRYRTGIGAMMFVISDLFIFSRFGPLEGSSLPDFLVWPLYFGGQALIAWGVVDTLTGETGKRTAY